MIPKITECMLPLLQYMNDKEIHSAEECREYISRVFNLSNDDKALLKSIEIQLIVIPTKNKNNRGFLPCCIVCVRTP